MRDHIKIKPSGLPIYCVRKKGGGSAHNFYYQKNDFRVPLPHPDHPDFWERYLRARGDCAESLHLSDTNCLSHMGMNKNELDQYFHGIERGARQRAKAAGRIYKLPKYWGADKYVEQEARCALTGIIMRKPDARFDPYGPSIDRIDSSLGYMPENCQLVILHVNLSKKDLGEDEFIRLCRSVVTHHRKRIANKK